jgi:uncharacterized glyoxalase superfamily protein PhnB
MRLRAEVEHGQLCSRDEGRNQRHSATEYLGHRRGADASAVREWLLALGFTEDLLIAGDDDRSIHHCQLDWPEGGRVTLSSTDERPTPCQPGTNSLHVVTADPDAVMARARALDATVVHELTDQTDYPSRDFTVADPDGNHWTFATFAS